MNAILILAAVLNLNAWKGETLFTEIPDGTTVGKPIPGVVDIRRGVLKPVRYNDHPDRPDAAREAFDRVDWTAQSGGPRVACFAVSRRAKSGEYQLGDVKLKVVNRTLPPAKNWKFRLDLWQHPWSVARYHQVRPFSPEHLKTMEPLLKELGACGAKFITTTLVFEPWMHQCYDGYGSMIKVAERADGSGFDYDFSDFDAYVSLALKCGVGPDIACHSLAPWGLRVHWTGRDGKDKWEHLIPGKERFEWFWTPCLKAFAAHLKAKGWLEHTYLAMDERCPEEMKAVSDFIVKLGLGFKIAACGNRVPSEYEGIRLDDFSLSIQFVNEKFINEAKARRKEGLFTTTYVCNGPFMPNTFLCSEPAEAYWLAVYEHVAGFDGLLRWAYNSWDKDPMVDGSNGKWMSGDTFLVYPDGSPSRRLLMLRNGIQAAEKWRILDGRKPFRDRLKAMAERYDLKRAFSTDTGWFRDLRRDTDELLNSEK